MDKEKRVKTRSIQKMLEDAKKCPGIGLCKLDFLDTGICPAGKEHKYRAFYPEGRHRLFRLLAEKGDDLPVTKGLIEIGESCSSCGICDKQCFMEMEIRAHDIMDTLKKLIKEKKNSLEPEEPEADDFLNELRAIVGEKWAQNDRYILASYIEGLTNFLLSPGPKYVALPATTEETAAIVKLCAKHNIPYEAIGSGSIGSIKGGLIIDFHRMDKVEIDRFSYTATIGPAVQGYRLLQEAAAYKLRPNIGQAASSICANQLHNGIMSLFQTRTPSMGDNLINARMVTPEGEIIDTSGEKSQNLFSTNIKVPDLENPGTYLCTEQRIKLHEIPETQKAGVIGFSDFQEALTASKEIARSHMADVAVVMNIRLLLWVYYISFETAEKMQEYFRKYMGVNYVLLVIGHDYEVEEIQKRYKESFFDDDIFGLFVFGYQEFFKERGRMFLENLAVEEKSISGRFLKAAEYLIKVINTPPSELFAALAPPDLRPFFNEYFEKSHYIKFVYQVTSIINASRLIKKGRFWSYVYISHTHDFENIFKVEQFLKEKSEKHGLDYEFFFAIPFEDGKFVQFEYDIFYDPADNKEKRKIKKCFYDIIRDQDILRAATPGLIWQNDYIFNGLAKKEHILYEKLPVSHEVKK